jgi:hypothetical protein
MHLQLIRHVDLLEGFLGGKATQGTASASLVQLVLFEVPITGTVWAPIDTVKSELSRSLGLVEI